MKKQWLLVAGIIAMILLIVIFWRIIGSKTLASLPYPPHLLATLCDVPGMPCGGRLVSQPLPCFNFPGVVWAKVLVSGGVDAGGPVISYAFLPTVFLHFIPTHIGQNFVGITAGIGFCATDPTNFRRGFTLPYGFFYGTSLI